jgi:hypothetical protein
MVRVTSTTKTLITIGALYKSASSLGSCSGLEDLEENEGRGALGIVSLGASIERDRMASPSPVAENDTFNCTCVLKQRRPNSRNSFDDVSGSNQSPPKGSEEDSSGEEEQNGFNYKALLHKVDSLSQLLTSSLGIERDEELGKEDSDPVDSSSRDSVKFDRGSSRYSTNPPISRPGGGGGGKVVTFKSNTQSETEEEEDEQAAVAKLQFRSPSPFNRSRVNSADLEDESIDSKVRQEWNEKFNSGHLEAFDVIDGMASDKFHQRCGENVNVGTCLFELLLFQSKQLAFNPTNSYSQAFELLGQLVQIFKIVSSTHEEAIFEKLFSLHERDISNLFKGQVVDATNEDQRIKAFQAYEVEAAAVASSMKMDFVELVENCLLASICVKVDYCSLRLVREALLLLVLANSSDFSEEAIENGDLKDGFSFILQLADQNGHFDTMDYIRQIMTFSTMEELESHYDLQFDILDIEGSDQGNSLPLKQESLLKVSARFDSSPRTLAPPPPSPPAAKKDKKKRKNRAIAVATKNAESIRIYQKNGAIFFVLLAALWLFKCFLSHFFPK